LDDSHNEDNAGGKRRVTEIGELIKILGASDEDTSSLDLGGTEQFFQKDPTK
jgi:hypothetical protein